MITRTTYLNALIDANLAADADEAGRILDVVFAVPMRGLDNGDRVELPGLGFISIDRGRGADCLSYSPENAHIMCGTSRSARAA